MKLSIIIVTYNCMEMTIQCLDDIKNLKIENSDYDTFVVDNGSIDGSSEVIPLKAPWVKYIKNEQNFGFARANNQALRLTKSEYILLLNPDTEIPQGTIEMTIKAMEENQTVGVSTCKVELANGKLDKACHRGFPTPWSSFTYFSGLAKLFPKSRLFGGYHLTYLPLDQSHEIDTPSGCFYLVRRKAIEEVGLLDEDYFLYGEDVDWSYRIKKVGWKILYYPKVKIIHHKGMSSGIKAKTSKISKAKKDTKSLAVNAFHDAMWLFYRKHLQKNHPFFVGWLVYVGIWIKRRLSLISKQV